MYLSKTKYCRGVQCEKILWLDTYKKEEEKVTSNAAVLDNGTEVGILAKGLFGEYKDVTFDENLNRMVEETSLYMQEETCIITEASFQYKNLFCSVDILKKKRNKLEIYEVKSSTEIKDIYKEDVAYQYYLLKKLGYDVAKVFIVYINKNYERTGPLDLAQLFVMEEVTDFVIKHQKKVEENISYFEGVLEEREKNDLIAMHCFKPYPCPYFSYCTKHLDKNNVFTLHRMNKKEMLKLYHAGITSFEQLKTCNLKEIYKRQICNETKTTFEHIDVENIKHFLETLSMPLYFLDFETFQEAIPPYDYMKPYMQIPFQYSLHYIENGTLKHKEFLAEPLTDPRRGLALQLVEDIPKNACVLAYNMSFEKMIIQNLSNLYPDLKEHLLSIYNNMKDLMVPFKEGYYYNQRMRGSYSIKYVLPALFPHDASLNYQNLEGVHNGSEAMHTYKELHNRKEEERQKTKKDLLKYCELDTFAMVKIWEKLQEVTRITL